MIYIFIHSLNECPYLHTAQWEHQHYTHMSSDPYKEEHAIHGHAHTHGQHIICVRITKNAPQIETLMLSLI